jgi:RNHCP domain
MYEEIYELTPNQGKRRQRYKSIRSGRGHANRTEEGFRCQQCGAYVYTMPMLAGVNNRNHCPFCLWSQHVDYIKPGDRMSACKAVMQPIGLTVKAAHDKYSTKIKGELMLIHRCRDCSKVSINRIAADDQVEMLMRVYRDSLTMDEITKYHLNVAKIHLMQAKDERTVLLQLYGCYCQR